MGSTVPVATRSGNFDSRHGLSNSRMATFPKTHCLFGVGVMYLRAPCVMFSENAI